MNRRQDWHVFDTRLKQEFTLWALIHGRRTSALCPDRIQPQISWSNAAGDPQRDDAPDHRPGAGQRPNPSWLSISAPNSRTPVDGERSGRPRARQEHSREGFPRGPWRRSGGEPSGLSRGSRIMAASVSERPRVATPRNRAPSNVTSAPFAAPQRLCAFSSMASNTGARSPDEELMTCKTSTVAVCCSSASSRSAVHSSSFRSAPSRSALHSASSR